MKKNVILALIISLFLNGFLPKYSLFSSPYDMLSNLIQNQPLLQYYFSLSQIPLQLVAKALGNELTAQTAHNHRDRESSPANTSSAFSLLASAGTGVNKNVLPRAALLEKGSGASGPFLSAPYERSNIKSSATGGAPGGSLLLFLILILFVLRPRSALSDGNFVRNYTHLLSPIRSR